MREIEYRGKNKDIGWVYGQLVFDTNKNPYIVKEVEQDSSYGLEETMLYVTMWYRVDPETVGQYTGLKDKNGVKIYEGDIVEFIELKQFAKNEEDFEKLRGIIVFEEGEFLIKYEGSAFGPTFYHLRLCKSTEVIGNIYDNPELLEGGTNEVRRG